LSGLVINDILCDMFNACLVYAGCQEQMDMRLDDEMFLTCENEVLTTAHSWTGLDYHLVRNTTSFNIYVYDRMFKANCEDCL
jgi:hypothetical protein